MIRGDSGVISIFLLEQLWNDRMLHYNVIFLSSSKVMLENSVLHTNIPIEMLVKKIVLLGITRMNAGSRTVVTIKPKGFHAILSFVSVLKHFFIFHNYLLLRCTGCKLDLFSMYFFIVWSPR